MRNVVVIEDESDVMEKFDIQAAADAVVANAPTTTATAPDHLAFERIGEKPVQTASTE